MADGHLSFRKEDDIASCYGDDFDEEHVWNVLMDKKDQTLKVKKLKEPPAFSLPTYLPTAATMMISKSLNSNAERTIVAQCSAPVNIPDWSKIYCNKRVGEGSVQGFHGVSREEDHDFQEDDDGGIPPHEWIAKKVARNQISSFSMCEGMGRTLKGRDLSMVRNTVLARTGFLE